MSSDMIIGFFFLILAIYGSFAVYRILRYNELNWAYLSLWNWRERGYPRWLCLLVGIINIPAVLIIYYVAIVILIASFKE